MAEPRKDLGENDVSFVDMAKNAVEKVADSVSHKLHPMVEQYATLFKTGARTPVLWRPSDYGMEYEDCFFLSMDGVPLEAWFIPANRERGGLAVRLAGRRPDGKAHVSTRPVFRLTNWP